jgi:hypothetical protein
MPLGRGWGGIDPMYGHGLRLFYGAAFPTTELSLMGALTGYIYIYIYIFEKDAARYVLDRAVRL